MVLFLQQLQQQHLSNMLWSEHHSEQVKSLWKANNFNNVSGYGFDYNSYNNNNSDIVPLFLPYDFILHHFIYVIASVVIVLTILYITFIQYFDTIMKFLLYSNSNNHNDRSTRTTTTSFSSSSCCSTSTSSTSTSTTTSISTKIIESFTIQQKYKLCYQMTNCITNLCLGCLGIYYEYYYNYYNTTTNTNTLENNNIQSNHLLLSIRPPPNYSIITSITNYDHCIYMSALQIGYQLWAIPMGIYVIHEPISMIIHHISVIICSSMSGLLLYGFRFYTPFFYGIVEISSIPLAFMNAFKDHPYTLQYYYPNIYLTIRIIFAITFLYIRIIMFLPRKYYFLRDQILLWTSINERYNNSNSTSTNNTSSNTQYYTILLYQCFMAIVSFSAFFLLLLQTYWAVLIVKGIIHIATGKNRSKNIASNNNGTQHVPKQQQQQQQQHDNHSIPTTKTIIMNGNHHSNNNTNNHNHICEKSKVRINGKHD